MTSSEKRRQKKLEEKKTKRKDQQRAVARIESSGISGRILAARNWTVFDTRVSADLNEDGIGYATIARRGPFGQVVGIIFLLDIYCLGVKDVAVHAGFESDWSLRMEQTQRQGNGMLNQPPEAVRKLVECSLAYANSFGIAPCREWPAAAQIFGQIDASKCSSEFPFGKDGKPFFIAGPNDGPLRIQKIMQILDENAGSGNYHFFIPVGGPDSEFLDDGEDEDEGEDEEDYANFN